MEHMPISAPEKVGFQEAIAVRDVGVGGSNPLTPTSLKPNSYSGLQLIPKIPRSKSRTETGSAKTCSGWAAFADRV